MTEAASDEALALARRHLAKVQAAWGSPTDWADLSVYGLYCIEAAIGAAVQYLGWEVPRSHPKKIDVAERLMRERGLPDVSVLLRDPNEARKAEAYGDAQRPDLDPESVAIAIEEYVDEIARRVFGDA